jgi:hypothetical protein
LPRKKIAVLGDIESLFFQVKVPSEDCDCLRFYWWKNLNTEIEPLVYRMNVHLFGATSSPSCCNFALHRTAEKHKDDFLPNVAETVMTNMYVDDCLTSKSTKEDAKSLIRDISALCQMGGFHLTKFLSNSVEVMQSISEEDRAANKEKWNLSSANKTQFRTFDANRLEIIHEATEPNSGTTLTRNRTDLI